MAAIGYHFRSKDALLMAAMLEAFDEWRAARTVGPVQVALLSGLIT
jgi:AcrR family transcriptional regulator